MFLMLQLNMFKPPVAAYMSSPCHIELILSEKEEPVKKEVCGSLYTVCVHLSNKSDTVVLIWLICSSGGVSDCDQEGLNKGALRC